MERRVSLQLGLHRIFRSGSLCPALAFQQTYSDALQNSEDFWSPAVIFHLHVLLLLHGIPISFLAMVRTENIFLQYSHTHGKFIQVFTLVLLSGWSVLKEIKTSVLYWFFCTGRTDVRYDAWQVWFHWTKASGKVDRTCFFHHIHPGLLHSAHQHVYCHLGWKHQNSEWWGSLLS